MFKHKHYVPILKGKRAEFPALGKLKHKANITPLIEAVPTAKADIVPKQMVACGWPDHYPYLLDMLFFDDEDSTATNKALPVVVEALKAAASRSQVAIPVTGTGRSPAYQIAVRDHTNGEIGAAIRLVPDDFDDVKALASVLLSLTTFLKLKRTSIDLILDVGSTAGHGQGTIKQIHQANIDLLPNVSEWRTLTVSAGSFPLGLGDLKRDQWNKVGRSDWLAWEALIGGPTKPKRLPSFSDYAIAHPGLPPSGRATILAQLRYSTPKNFMIWKGKNAITEGFDQFFAICKDLIGRTEYRGAAFSMGDAEIQAKATNSGSPGNAETWRKIGTNHHIETVLDQISNLP
jgi:Beta protein